MLHARPGHDDHGALVEISTGLLAPVRRPRGMPPNPPARLFGREPAVVAIEDAIGSQRPIVIAGELGSGKSTVLDAVLNRDTTLGIADGIVQIPGALGGVRLSLDEIAQRLYDALWDTSPNHRRIDASNARGELAGCRPLLAIDEVPLSPDDQRLVASLIPGSPVIITADATPLGGGDFVGLGPLPRPDSVRLLAERSLLAVAAAPALFDRVAHLLEDWPGALSTLADLIKAGRVTLDAAVARMEAGPLSGRPTPASAYERLLALIDQTFSRAEVNLLETVAGLAGASVREDLAVWAAGTTGDVAAGLVASGVAWRASPRLQIDAGLRAALRRDRTRTRTRAAAEALASEPGRLLAADGSVDPLDVPDAILALDTAAATGQPTNVMVLARALDRWFLVNRLWSLWDDVLHLAARAAERLGDERETGWVLHQSGTRALLTGEFAAARGLLRDALEIRRRVDVHAVDRTERALKVLRVVMAPSPWWHSLGGRGPLRALIVVMALLGGTFAGPAVVDALRSLFGPDVTPTPSISVEPSASASPAISVEPSASASPTLAPTPTLIPTAVVDDLAVEVEFDELSLEPTGDWTGTATVMVTGGVAPYRFEIEPEARTGDGPEEFTMSGTDCASAPLEGTVRDSEDRLYAVDHTFAPESCAGFSPPPPPDVGDPFDGSVLYANCATTPMGFGWSSDGNEGGTWQVELEVADGTDWRPLTTQDELPEPRTNVDLPCESTFRWRAATVSPAGWMSEPSAWSTLAVLPTAVPVLGEPDIPGSCVTTVELSWQVERTDGILDYELRITDESTDETATFVIEQTTFQYDVPTCDADYTWSVVSRDREGRAGAPSEAGAFHMPEAEG